MLISVVNQCRSIPDEQVVNAIRAINRQLAEDFYSFWSRYGRLRFDGTAISQKPLDNLTQDMRGDAIIYLWDSYDSDDPFGYHDLHHSGIPFGFVFLELSEALGEPWTVTLSHEAIELLMDPEVNLLVKGPHPDPYEDGREVFHWFEMCDAVQDETYKIDGIEVSNFLLPLYFTLHEEDGKRNDFLGTLNCEGRTITSFGVNPGGYAGFYDPLINDHDIYTPDKRSRDRQALKSNVKALRRAIRYQESCVARRHHDQIRPHQLSVDTTKDIKPLRCESIVVELAVPKNVRALNEILQNIIAERLTGKWTVNRFIAGDTDLELVCRDRQVTPAEAWDICHELVRDPKVRMAEPFFEFEEPGMTVESNDVAVIRAFGGRDDPFKDGEKDKEWALKNLGIDQVFKLDWNGRTPGEGIVIGHPDTGFTTDPEIINRLDIANGFDFVDNDNLAKDLMNGGNEGHGTATGSVLVSERRQADDPDNQISGAAPGAVLVPLRVNKRVILLSMRNLAKAFAYAINKGCHIISLSMGGLHLPFKLKRLIQEAVDKGIIVVCAAGNRVKFVVSPAFDANTIAVAGSNINDKPWRGTSRGEQVDISAPGENVWRSMPLKVADNLVWQAGVGSGTSYATALTAGVAALWLSFHGRDNLVDKYGEENLVAVFRYMLQQTSRTPPDWNNRRYGPGIVNAYALLNTPLPDHLPFTAEEDSLIHDTASTMRRAIPGANADKFLSMTSQSKGVSKADSFLHIQELLAIAGTDMALHDALDSGKSSVRATQVSKAKLSSLLNNMQISKSLRSVISISSP